MSKVTNIRLESGAVTYVPEREAIPPSKEIDGNVTVNNTGNPGSPAHYAISFNVGVYAENEGVKSISNVYWNDSIVAETRNAPYHEVEDESARRLPAMLREAADLIQKAMDDHDAEIE